MKHYDYQKKLNKIWEKAVTLYKNKKRGANTYFTKTEQAFLDSIGATSQEIYDFAEDYVHDGEPDFTTMAMIHDVRRSYFLEKQKGKHSSHELVQDNLPPKEKKIRGIVWLPRIIEKAKSKLRGELDPDTMYDCGGDRRFFKANDVHPAEFLRVVWKYDNNKKAIINWVASRSKSSKA